MVALMPRRTTKTLFSVRINTKLFERLESFSRTSGRSRSEVVDRAIEEYLNKNDPQIPPHKPAGRLNR